MLPDRRRRGAIALALALAVVTAVVILVGLRAGRERGSPGGGASGSTTTLGLGPTITPAPALALPPGAGGDATTTSAPGPGATPTPGAASPPTPPPTPPPVPGRLLLGGNDLGVTRVGAPSREAVAAVAGALGRPLGDPASDSACIGAEEETSWAGFRLASSGGKVSGWRSTSPALSTPAGIAVGATVAALRQAYGAALQVRPVAEPGDLPVFGDRRRPRRLPHRNGPADTVTSIFNGTCETE